MAESLPSERAETFLEQDPRVEAFEVFERTQGLEIKVVGSQDWLAGQRQASRVALSGRVLRQWRLIYDRSYRWDQIVRAPNFDVWISGFTHEPIPFDRMQLWLDGVLAQLRSVSHGKVLDIGCGVGLVLAALAPGGVVYDGIDLSEEAIASLSAWVATQEHLRHVRLGQGGAHDLQDRDGDGVELVILNSVVQYFPDRAYLERVLQAAAAQVAPGGSIFLGDLRAPALLPMRAVNVAATRAGMGATAAQVRAEAEVILTANRELAVDPVFFQEIGALLPRLGHVQFSLKPMQADHELAGYRYDALLRLDAPKAPIAPGTEAPSLEAIVERLAADLPPALAATNLPNARLVKDAKIARILEMAPADARLIDLVGAGECSKREGIEPETLLDAVRALGYSAEFRFSPGASDGRFDALILREGEFARWPEAAIAAPASNDPLGAELVGNLRQELRTAIEAAVGARLASFSLTLA